MRSGPTERKPSVGHSSQTFARQVSDDRQPSAEACHFGDRTRDGDRFFAVIDEEVGEPDGIRGPISRASCDDGVAAIASEQRDRRVRQQVRDEDRGFGGRSIPSPGSLPLLELIGRRHRPPGDAAGIWSGCIGGVTPDPLGIEERYETEGREIESGEAVLHRPAPAQDALEVPQPSDLALPAQMARGSPRSSSTAGDGPARSRCRRRSRPVSPCEWKIASYQSTLFDAQMIDSSFIPCSDAWMACRRSTGRLRVVCRHGETGS